MNSFCRPAANTPQPCPVNPPGFRYVPGSAQPSARPCEINTFSLGLAGQTSCTPCPAGTATDPEAPLGEQTNSSSCRAPPGFFFTGDGVYPCAAGSFKAGYTGHNSSVALRSSQAMHQ
ncbi:hypothetical protein OEZ86_005426 [Tetradesmus obliquus]|nr:hypothetical protein OEZ86_005426 [Tetradesmus obliquus]